MSGDFQAFVLYMSTWDSESDERINSIIEEHSYFKQLDNFNADKYVDEEFKTLDDLACEVMALTVAADATKIAADAAAVSAIWSFGFGMTAFVALEAGAIIEQGVASKKSEKLNKKLTTVDTDIAKKGGGHVKHYIKSYKKNNNLINSKAPKGLDQTTCRSILMQFLAQVERKKSLTPEHFRQYAASARAVLDSDQIDKILEGLDELNLSGKSDEDIKKFIGTLKGLSFSSSVGGEIAKNAVHLVYGVSVAIMAKKMNVASIRIREIATSENIPLEEVGTSAFEAMDAVGKFSAAIAVAMAVVDVVLDVWDIVDVVKQCKKMCHELDHTIKPKYKKYFHNIGKAAHQYRKAIASSSVITGTSADTEPAKEAEPTKERDPEEAEKAQAPAPAEADD